ncbi:MAG: hypothetical protein AB7D43_06060 [Sulfurimonadaceae bacterium]
MEKELKIKISIDNQTGAIKVVDGNFKELSQSINKADKNTDSFTKRLKDMAHGAASIYVVKKAFDSVVGSGFAYNNAMEQSIAGLTSLNVATSANVSAMGHQLSITKKYEIAQKEAVATASELARINAETPHTLGETNQIYKAMYVSMKQAGASTGDMIELTKKISIAAGSAGIEFNALLAGVDGLATGTVEVSSDFGRFLSGLGLTNEELKKSGDVVKLLKERFSEFTAVDTMEVAVSNLRNEWEMLTGVMTKDTFEATKQEIKEATGWLSEYRGELKAFLMQFKDLADIRSEEDINIRRLQLERDLQEELDKNTKFMWNSDKQIRSDRIAKIKEEIEQLDIKAKALKNEDSLVKKVKTVAEADTSTLDAMSFKIFKEYEKEKQKELKETKKLRDQYAKDEQAILDKIALLKASGMERELKQIELSYRDKFALYANDAEMLKKLTEASNMEAAAIRKKYADKDAKERAALKKQAQALFDPWGAEVEDINARFMSMEQAVQGIFDASQMQTFYTAWAKEIDGVEEKLKHKESAQAQQEAVSNLGELYNTSKGLMSEFYEEGDKRRKKQAEIDRALMVVNQTARLADLAMVLSTETSKQTMYGTTALANALTEPFPVNITAYATVAAMLASLGIMVSGGGSSPSSYMATIAHPDANTTVLGGGDKQSKSIVNALEVLEEYAKPEFAVLSQMAYHLRNIDSNIAGATRDILRNAGFALGVGAQEGQTYYDGEVAGGYIGSKGLSRGAVAFFTGGIGLGIDALIGNKVSGAIAGGIDKAFSTLEKIPYLGAISSLVKAPFDLLNKGLEKLGLGGGGYNWQMLANSGIGFGTSNAQAGKSYTAAGAHYGDIRSQQAFRAQTLADLIADFEGLMFQSMAYESMSKDWKGSASYSYWSTTTYQEIDDQLAKTFQTIFGGMRDTIVLASDALGKDVLEQLNRLPVTIGSIDLKGLSGDEITEKLEEAFSTQSDKFVEQLFTPIIKADNSEINAQIAELNKQKTDLSKTPWGALISAWTINPQIADLQKQLKPDTYVKDYLFEFQAVGEGMYETLIRVATGIETASYYSDRLGSIFEHINYYDIENTNADVAFEALYESIRRADGAAYGFNNGVLEILRTLDGSASDLYETYVALEGIRGMLTASKQDAANISAEMFRGAGGVDAFSKALSTYMSEFLTQEEQLQYARAELAKEFGRMDIAMPQSSAAFRELLEGVDTTSAEGQELYGRLIVLSKQAAEVFSEAEAKAKSSLDIYVEFFNGLQASLKGLAEYRKNLLFNEFTAQNKEDLFTALAGTSSALSVELAKGAKADSQMVAQSVSDLQKYADNYLAQAKLTAGTREEYQNAVNEVASLLDFGAQAQEIDAQVLLLGDILKNEELQRALLAEIATNTGNNGFSISYANNVIDVVPFANGGIVTRPTVGLVGEAGYPEAIVPLKDRFALNTQKLEDNSDEQTVVAREILIVTKRLTKLLEEWDYLGVPQRGVA